MAKKIQVFIVLDIGGWYKLIPAYDKDRRFYLPSLWGNAGVYVAPELSESIFDNISWTNKDMDSLVEGYAIRKNMPLRVFEKLHGEMRYRLSHGS